MTHEEYVKAIAPFEDFKSRAGKCNDNAFKSKLMKAYAKGLYDIGTFAKVLDIPKLGRTNIFKWFKSHNYLMSSNIPYQQYMKYFSVKEVNKNSMIFTKTLLKPEGVIYFYKKIAKEYNIDKTIEQVSEELKGEE